MKEKIHTSQVKMIKVIEQTKMITKYQLSPYLKAHLK